MRGLFACLLLVLFSCSSLPGGILAPNQLYPVMKDVMQVDEYINNSILNDTTINVKEKRSILYEQVFKLHNTTKEQYYRSFTYFQKHPDLQKELFDSLSIRLQKKEPKKEPARKAAPVADSLK